MKVVSKILFFSFLLILACPMVQSAVSATSDKCEMQSCSKNESGEDGSCPFTMCKSCACCFCCLIFPVENKKIEINSVPSALKHITTNGNHLKKGFTNDAWQPPELLMTS